MSRTRAQMKKQAKKKSRERNRRRDVNIRKNNLGPEKWVLQILLDGAWCEARRFRKWDSVLKHVENTEKLREAGDVIVPGKVFSLETNKEVLTIEGSDKKGIMPDKLSGNEKAADKAKPGFLKRMVGTEEDDSSEE